jgi:PAS domain S-box-containing protein
MGEGSNADAEDFRTTGGASGDVYETIFREMDDAVFFIDVRESDDDFTFIFRRNNAAHQQRTGFSDDEFRGQTPRELLGDEQGAAVAANYRRCVKQRDTIEYKETLEFPSGKSHWQTKLTPITENGQVTQIVGVARDVTEQKEHEQEMQRMHRRFEAVLGTMPAAVFLKDTDGQYLMMNQACRELFGVGDKEIVGLADDDFFPPEVAEKARSDDRQVIENGETIEIEERIPTATGNTVRLTRKSPVYDDDGDIMGLCGVSTDITERKEREKKLEETKNRLDVALEGTKTGVWEWDLETDEAVWTESMERLFGVAPSTFEGTYDAFTEYVHPDDLPALEREIEQTLATGEPLKAEYRIQREDDKQLWGETRAEVVERANGSRRMVGTVTDITERKEDEEAIKAAQEELRQIIDLVPDLIFVKNREGVYLLANETTAEAYDLTPEEVEGKREADIIPSVEDSEEFRKDDLKVIESGEPRTIPEEELTTADGETRILQTTKIPYQTSDSGEDAVLGYARDVTELKEYEQRLEAQRDNLDILNQVVRHDIRNNLQLVLSYAEILDGNVNEGHEEYRQKILEAARNAVDITTTARDVTEVLLRSESDHAPVGVQHVLEEQVNDVRASHERAIVSVDEAIPDVEVLADNMLGSIFRNLLNNAIVHNDKAIPEVAVSVTADDEVVRVRIADNGPGIPDDQKEEVFQRGEKGLDSGGTGLGLYLVQTLTDRYGGDVWVEDNSPEGSLFIIELPRCE